jgi:hypothetical protein
VCREVTETAVACVWQEARLLRLKMSEMETISRKVCGVVRVGNDATRQDRARVVCTVSLSLCGAMQADSETKRRSAVEHGMSGAKKENERLQVGRHLRDAPSGAHSL